MLTSRNWVKYGVVVLLQCCWWRWWLTPVCPELAHTERAAGLLRWGINYSKQQPIAYRKMMSSALPDAVDSPPVWSPSSKRVSPGCPYDLKAR